MSLASARANPMMAISLQQHYYSKTVRELVRALNEAWAQADARAGSAFGGSRAPEPRLLAYRHVCRIGTFVEQLLVHVDRPKVAIVVLDDLVDDPACLCDLLGFLDLDEDIPLMFPNENRGYSLRQQWATSAIQAFWFGDERLGLPHRAEDLLWPLEKLNHKRAVPPSLEMVQELDTAFAEEREQMFTILGRHYPACGLAQVSQSKQRVNVDSNRSQGMCQGRM